MTKKNNQLDDETRKKLEEFFNSLVDLHSLISEADPKGNVVNKNMDLNDSYVDLIKMNPELTEDNKNRLIKEVDQRRKNQLLVQELALKAKDLDRIDKDIKEQLRDDGEKR